MASPGVHAAGRTSTPNYTRKFKNKHREKQKTNTETRAHEHTYNKKDNHRTCVTLRRLLDDSHFFFYVKADDSIPATDNHENPTNQFVLGSARETEFAS